MNLKQKKQKERTQAFGNSKKNILNFRNFNYFIYTLAVCLAVFFLVTKNDIAVKGFVIRDLQIKNAELDQKKMQLEMDTMNKESMVALNAKAQQLNMVSVGKYDFVEAKNGVVARR